MLPITLSFIIFILTIYTHFYTKKINKNNAKTFFIKTILITMLLELTIFNVNYYRTNFINSKEITYSGDSLSNIITVTPEKYKKIDIKNINQKVKTIYIKFDDYFKNINVDYDIYYSDETTIGKFLATKTYNGEVSKTKYAVIDLSRKCKRHFFSYKE